MIYRNAPCAARLLAITYYNARAMTKSASITVHVHASAAHAFPLFDPVNEMNWDPQWNPELLGSRVEEGLVFLVGDGEEKATWVIDRYDPIAHVIGYVAVTKSMLTRIRIQVVPDGIQSVASVTYTRTALNPESEAAVKHFAAHFPTQAQHWEAAINSYLERAKNQSNH